MKLEYIVEKTYCGQPLLKVLQNHFVLSTRLIKKLKLSGKLFCNDKLHRVIDPVITGDTIIIDMDFVEETEFLIPQDIPLDIVFEDECLIVINKQPGIVVHPSANHYDNTIANALLFHFNKNNEHIKIRPVSRLDRDTSGIILFAKNAMIQENLIKQMAAKTFIKEYLGVVSGIPSEEYGTIDLPIARKPGSTIEREISIDGAKSVTHYKIIKKFSNSAFLSFNLETGRTHQIRVHCKAFGHPLIGDTLYSPFSTNLINRQALHSQKISFIHPLNKNRVELRANTHQDFRNLIQTLQKT